MIILELKKTEVDYCSDCGGIWLDKGELELMTGFADNDSIKSLLIQVAGSSEKKKRCPVCTKRMSKFTSDKINPIIIDVCNQMHGIWFDFGELQKVISNITDESNEMIEFLNDVFKFKLSKKEGGKK